VSAEAVEDCTLLTWAAVDMMEFVKEIAAGDERHAHDAEHAMEFQERLQQLATERVERRLAHTLLRLAAQSGVRTTEGVEIGMALSRQTLAEMWA
jgi:CRP-like cAMP-binding protein